MKYLLLMILLSCTAQKKYKSTDSFSDTQQWDSTFLESSYSQNIIFLPKNWKEILKVSSPDLSSDIVKAEINELIKLQTKRDQKNIENIQRELQHKNFILGHIQYKKFYNENPECHQLLASITEMGAIVFYFKRKFDRIRPSFLNSKLKTAIQNPSHPAYPSGHSTQAHFMAYVLGSLFPKHQNIFLKDAFQIGVNREIAGVHYRSDTMAGKKLGHDIFKLMYQNQKFKNSIMRCKKSL